MYTILGIYEYRPLYGPIFIITTVIKLALFVDLISGKFDWKAIGKTIAIQ